MVTNGMFICAVISLRHIAIELKPHSDNIGDKASVHDVES